MQATELTTLLDAIRTGDIGARHRLFEAVYPHLHALAARRMRVQSSDHTLQATALVNEAVVRILAGNSLLSTTDRIGFFALASHAMRSVLVDHARRRRAAKRFCGSSLQRVPLDDVVQEFERSAQLSVLDLDEALVQLATFSHRQHEIVSLRFFGGLRFTEIAEYLQISLSTVEKDWAFARAWLCKRLDRD